MPAKLLEVLMSLVEGDYFDALDQVLTRLTDSKSVEHLPNDSLYKFNYEISGKKVASLMHDNFWKATTLYILAGDVLKPSNDLDWECDTQIAPVFGYKERACKVKVTEKNFRKVLSQLPRLIKLAKSVITSRAEDISNKEAIARETFKKVKDYLEQVAKEEGKEVEASLSGVKGTVELISKGKSGKATWFSVSFSPGRAILTFVGMRGQTLYFDANHLKRGAKKVLSKFPAIERVNYIDKSRPAFEVLWKDPSKMPDDLVGLLKTLRKK